MQPKYKLIDSLIVNFMRYGSENWRADVQKAFPSLTIHAHNDVLHLIANEDNVCHIDFGYNVVGASVSYPGTLGCMTSMAYSADIGPEDAGLLACELRKLLMVAMGGDIVDLTAAQVRFVTFCLKPSPVAVP